MRTFHAPSLNCPLAAQKARSNTASWGWSGFDCNFLIVYCCFMALHFHTPRAEEKRKCWVPSVGSHEEEAAASLDRARNPLGQIFPSSVWEERAWVTEYVFSDEQEFLIWNQCWPTGALENKEFLVQLLMQSWIYRAWISCTGSSKKITYAVFCCAFVYWYYYYSTVSLPTVII